MSNPKNLNETDGQGFCPERFRKSWSQAIAGETLPLHRLWEDDDDALYVSDEEQAEIEAQFGQPDDEAGDEWIDMTEWVKHGGALPRSPRFSFPQTSLPIGRGHITKSRFTIHDLQ